VCGLAVIAAVYVTQILTAWTRSPTCCGRRAIVPLGRNDGQRLPLQMIAARASDHDSPLLEPTLSGSAT
jgi:hypothetical protein